MAIRLYGMTCCWLTMPFQFFLPGREGWLMIPVGCYLIVHPKGTILFDSGLETTMRSDDPAVVKAALGQVAPLALPKLGPEDDVATRLRAFGIDPDKIDFIINSHLHFDHCGGNALIKNARHVIQKREWHAATTPELMEENLFIRSNYDHGHDRVEVEGEHDLFGDGSVVLVPTYGHTPGHQSLKVKLDDGEVLITGDCCYMRQTLDEMLLPDPKVVRNPEQMRQTLQLLKKFQDRGAFLIFGHDPGQWKHLNDGPVREITMEGMKRAHSLYERSTPTCMESPLVNAPHMLV